MSEQPNDKVRVQREREFSPHHILIGAAQLALERARKPEPGWLYDELVAMTFSAMALEALANAFGERFVPRWKDYESASPIAKLRVVALQLKLADPDFSTAPWTFALWLIKFRNKVAHAKPESIKFDATMSRADFQRMRLELPKSKLELEISLEHAERSLQTVSSIFELMCKHAPQEKLPGLLFDSFSGTVSGEKKG